MPQHHRVAVCQAEPRQSRSTLGCCSCASAGMLSVDAPLALALQRGAKWPTWLQWPHLRRFGGRGAASPGASVAGTHAVPLAVLSAVGAGVGSRGCIHVGSAARARLRGSARTAAANIPSPSSLLAAVAWGAPSSTALISAGPSLPTLVGAGSSLTALIGAGSSRLALIGAGTSLLVLISAGSSRLALIGAGTSWLALVRWGIGRRSAAPRSLVVLGRPLLLTRAGFCTVRVDQQAGVVG